MALTITHPSPVPTWRAGIAGRRIYVRRLIETSGGKVKQVSRPLNLLYVVLERGEGEAIPFCVTRPKGRLVFSDKRECSTGTAGSTGQWGTLPASKPGQRRSLTPTAWVAEVSRLISRERAEEIVRLLS